MPQLYRSRCNSLFSTYDGRYFSAVFAYVWVGYQRYKPSNLKPPFVKSDTYLKQFRTEKSKFIALVLPSCIITESHGEHKEWKFESDLARTGAVWYWWLQRLEKEVSGLVVRNGLIGGFCCGGHCRQGHQCSSFMTTNKMFIETVDGLQLNWVTTGKTKERM